MPLPFSAPREAIALLVLSLGFLLPPTAAQAALGDHPDVMAARRLFEARLRGQMAYRGLPGVVVGVVHGQELVWSAGYGFADVASKRRMASDTRFRIASHSKLFTATAVMQLRDAGKVRLDDPVNQHLPWFQMKPFDADDPLITVEDLLTHGAGLPREAGPHWSTYEFPTADEVRRYVQDRSAAISPSMRFKYSNLGFTLAGMLVEQVSGQPYRDYVQQRIFTPLGMKDSSVDQPVEGLATGYGRRLPDGTRQASRFVDARAMGPATGLTSTVPDLARFVSLQFRKNKVSGAQILSVGALRQMHRVRLLETNWTRGYAIGFSVLRDKEKVYVGHGGSYPGYQTNTLINLENQVGVIVLTNADDSAPSEFALYLMQTVGEAVAKAANPVPAAAPWDSAWSKYAGLYRRWSSDVEVVELNRSLVMIDPLSTTPELQTKLVPLGGGRFRFEATVGGGTIGETVWFEEKAGKVTRIYLGDSYADRVER